MFYNTVVYVHEALLVTWKYNPLHYHKPKKKSRPENRPFFD